MKFLALCEQQGRDPGDVVRQLIGSYIEAKGESPHGPQDMDHTLLAFLDWCVDGSVPPARPKAPQPARPRRVS